MAGSLSIFEREFRSWRSFSRYHYSLGGFAQFGTRPCYWSVSLEVRRVSSFENGCGVSQDRLRFDSLLGKVSTHGRLLPIRQRLPLNVSGRSSDLCSAGAGAGRLGLVLGLGLVLVLVMGRIVTVGGDLTERQIMSRLANPVTGAVSEECQKASRRWFRR